MQINPVHTLTVYSVRAESVLNMRQSQQARAAILGKADLDHVKPDRQVHGVLFQIIQRRSGGAPPFALIHGIRRAKIGKFVFFHAPCFDFYKGDKIRAFGNQIQLVMGKMLIFGKDPVSMLFQVSRRRPLTFFADESGITFFHHLKIG